MHPKNSNSETRDLDQYVAGPPQVIKMNEDDFEISPMTCAICGEKAGPIERWMIDHGPGRCD